jgi:nucleoside-diphosphate-sugar epimerase
MKKKILICGATGFIGKNIANYFSKKNYEVICVYNKKKKFNNKNIKWIKADLRKYQECLKATRNIDILIQAAATTSGSKDIINTPYVHVTDNAIINSYLLKASFQNKIKQFIFTSCTVMYGDSKKPLKENQVKEQEIFPAYYGVANTKLYIEKMCKFFSTICKTRFSIIRHSNIYGPNDKFDINKGHFIGSSIYKVFNEKNNYVKIFGKGDEKRDYLYIDDFLDFVNKIIGQKKAFEIINCGYGKSFKIKDVLNIIIKLSNKKKKIKYLSTSKNINVNILIDVKKAKKLLNWVPKHNLISGLKKTILWYKKNEKIL